MKKLIFLSLIFSLGLTACNKKANKGSTTTSKAGIKFRAGSFSASLAKAKLEGKPVFVDFYTTWCAPCKWMEKDVFNHSSVYQYYNENIVSVKVDAEKGEGPSLAKKYGVYGFPTLVYLDGEGNVLDQHVGMTTISNVLAMGERAVSSTKSN